MPTDAHFDDPLVNDAFDFSRYPMFKTRNAKPSTMPRNPHRVRGRAPLEACQRPRNVSEPQLISSTNYMRDSWFTDIASARTVGDIANLSSDDTRIAAHPSQITTVVATPDTGLLCDVNDDRLRDAPHTAPEDLGDIPVHVEPNVDSGEENSFYSMDSADQEAHPLLLSMPIIPQIKLERKATVREPDPCPFSDAAQNYSFLSPRIRDLKTPARMSSRRYGRILARTSPPVVVSDVHLAENDDHDAPTIREPQPFGPTCRSERAENESIELAYLHSAAEPLVNSPGTSDDEKGPLLKKETDESPHSDLLLSMIEDAGASLEPCNDSSDLGIDSASVPKSVSPKRLKRNHQRSLVNHSISFSSLLHAVSDGCASLDLLIRKPKTKSKTSIKLSSRERVSNVHDPTSKWAPKRGQIIIKVFVPSTDDIWKFRVPQDINLADFTSTVASKLDFAVSFSGSLWDEPKYYFVTDEQFMSWIKGRIRFGRNLPIVAHVLAPLPLVRLSVDGDGCEVWCYA